MKDMLRALLTKASIPPAAPRVNVTTNGTGIDLLGYDGARVDFYPGTVTDGVHTPKLQESDDNASFTDVAAADQIGTLAALASNVPQSVSYIGTKRYIRPVVTGTGATTGAAYSATAVLGHARHRSPNAGSTQTP